MAKGQDLSRHQQGIVRRYYEHHDTIVIQRLAEIVSDLYVEESPKKVAKLWERAAKALAAAGADDARTQTIVAERDLTRLAALVGELGVK